MIRALCNYYVYEIRIDKKAAGLIYFLVERHLLKNERDKKYLTSICFSVKVTSAHHARCNLFWREGINASFAGINVHCDHVYFRRKITQSGNHRSPTANVCRGWENVSVFRGQIYRLYLTSQNEGFV